jgi:hypothetical protein
MGKIELKTEKLSLFFQKLNEKLNENHSNTESRICFLSGSGSEPF